MGVIILCRDWSLVKHFHRGLYAAPLCCRSWTCDYCRPGRKARVAYQASLGAPNTFITLTTNPARPGTPASRAAELAHAWRRFVRYAKHYYGYASIPFFAVFEATKQGEPHLHILCRVKWIEQRVLSRFMNDDIDAPIVDIRRVHSPQQAAKYLSKYVGKAPGKFGKCKRYWQTRDYRRCPEEPAPPCEFAGGGWRKVQQSIDTLILHHTIQRHLIEKVGPMWKITTTGPPDWKKVRGRA